MFCKNCGQLIPDQSQYCAFCGAPVSQLAVNSSAQPGLGVLQTKPAPQKISSPAVISQEGKKGRIFIWTAGILTALSLFFLVMILINLISIGSSASDLFKGRYRSGYQLQDSVLYFLKPAMILRVGVLTLFPVMAYAFSLKGQRCQAAVPAFIRWLIHGYDALFYYCYILTPSIMLFVTSFAMGKFHLYSYLIGSLYTAFIIFMVWKHKLGLSYTAAVAAVLNFVIYLFVFYMQASVFGAFAL